jgi:predicted ester cyclase
VPARAAPAIRSPANVETRAAAVLVNGIQRTREQYVDDIRMTIAVFPDYVWELRHTVEQAPWLAAHLHAKGTRQHTFLGASGDPCPSRDRRVCHVSNHQRTYR